MTTLTPNTPRTPQVHPEGAVHPNTPRPYIEGRGVGGVVGSVTTPQSNSGNIPNLPALRSLGCLADVRPTIIVDTREQLPLVFSRLESVRGTLTSGDYSLRGGEQIFSIERKSIQDLVGSVVGESRERFFRELHRLRGYRFKRLLVVGRREEIEAGAYRSNVRPKAVLSTLSAIEVRFDTPVVFCPTAEEAAERIESWAYWFARELVESVNDLARATRQSTKTAKPLTTSP